MSTLAAAGAVDHCVIEPLVSLTLAQYREYEELKEKVRVLTSTIKELRDEKDATIRILQGEVPQFHYDDDDDDDDGSVDPLDLDSDANSSADMEDGGEGEGSVAVVTAPQVIQQQGGDADITDSPDSPGEPSKKKLKTGSAAEDTAGVGGGGVISVEISEKLEDRLGSVLCCAVCLGLPRSAIYQCLNGHLLCQACLHHVLADSRIRDETSTCPSCRVEISKHTASRNLAVEKALQELASACQFCSKEFPRNSLLHHEKELCEERKTTCKYNKIGCPWEGPKFELDGHEGNCIHPNKTGKEIMVYLESSEKELEKDKKIYKQLFGLLSFEKININEIQLKPYRTEEFVQKLFYESGRFSCFNNQWVIKAKVGSKVRDPTQSCDRDLQYQLILKTKPSAPLDLHFCPFPSPFADMKIKQPAINRFEFIEQNMESPYYPIPLIDSNEVNRLLSAKTINLRLIAFLQ